MFCVQWIISEILGKNPFTGHYHTIDMARFYANISGYTS